MKLTTRNQLSFARIHKCKHLLRRPNPDATYRRDKYRYEICDSCGVGLRSNRD